MDTPDFFIGARLASARVKARISLEKAATDTRIRVARLREIESDDFSGFAHPTYARLFLLDYAEYLGVPQDEIRPILPDATGSAGGGFQYIDALAADLRAKEISPRTRRRRLIGVGVGFAVLLLLSVIVLYTYVTLQKIERVAGSKALGELAKPTTPAAATPVPEPTEKPTPPPVLVLPEKSTEEAFSETTFDLTVVVPPATPATPATPDAATPQPSPVP